jgi:hypothetical protein
MYALIPILLVRRRMSISARVADAFAGQKRPDGREIRRIRHAFRRGLPAASMPFPER